MRKLFILSILVLCSCTTGFGRVFSQAVTSGTPPEIAVIPDALDAEYNLRSSYVMRDIVASTTPDGDVNAATAKATAVNDLQARIDAYNSLTDSLRVYLGVEKGADPLASFNAAAENRRKIVEAGVKAIKVGK